MCLGAIYLSSVVCILPGILMNLAKVPFLLWWHQLAHFGGCGFGYFSANSVLFDRAKI